ncbi:MAG: uracil-DNA glycosylase [Candidatus Syntrophonatronum acetioxidans]|uniref:Type-4 uracil-DNA glycosylase n=1 Tax=Candidatus Syntrophonatronum acetioxidans TaxID=1795816 RepID=A0A424YB36_9FIRM|nr:MAG: uracil-DNA glycosylase [Candidatus Syntrophonatronum acetioxidans]
MEEEVKECRRCELRKGCQQVVFGEGNPRALLMLVGEGPGGDEDRLGRPFVGRAGQLLDRILEAAGFKREEVYIANVVKCRPPSNRTPTPEEVQACYPHLQEQIKIISPGIIVCLGALSTKVLVDPKAQITRIRGSWLEKEGSKIMPTFHPAALLRDPKKKKLVWQDFQEVEREYKGLRHK